MLCEHGRVGQTQLYIFLRRANFGGTKSGRESEGGARIPFPFPH